MDSDGIRARQNHIYISFGLYMIHGFVMRPRSMAFTQRTLSQVLVFYLAPTRLNFEYTITMHGLAESNAARFQGFSISTALVFLVCFLQHDCLLRNFSKAIFSLTCIFHSFGLG
jgi:hypothetical protein